jgi:hypothetical protein
MGCFGLLLGCLFGWQARANWNKLGVFKQTPCPKCPPREDEVITTAIICGGFGLILGP